MAATKMEWMNERIRFYGIPTTRFLDLINDLLGFRRDSG
jgi:hypothetical protein